MEGRREGGGKERCYIVYTNILITGSEIMGNFFNGSSIFSTMTIYYFLFIYRKSYHANENYFW